MKKSALALVMLSALFTLTFAGCALLPSGGNSTANNGNTSQTTQGGQGNQSGTGNQNSGSNETVEYDYKEGVLTAVVDEKGNPKQNDFVIKGVILVGNRHSYFGTDDVAGALATFVKEGYKTKDINSSFYLNEFISVYVDTAYTGNAADVKILATPHKSVQEYEKMSANDLYELAASKGFIMDYRKPDEEEYKFVGENYVNLDHSAGKYDLLFTYKGKVAYFINLSLTVEPEK